MFLFIVVKYEYKWVCAIGLETKEAACQKARCSWRYVQEKKNSFLEFMLLCQQDICRVTQRTIFYILDLIRFLCRS